MEEDLLVKYYMNQAGSGFGEFYSGPIYQRGYGIGSFLGGLFKTVLPLLKRGGIAVGKELLRNGTNLVHDLENNVDPRTALTKRAKETVGNLQRKLMYGEGFKTSRYPLKRQLLAKPRKVKSKRKNKVKQNKSKSRKRFLEKNSDIFAF